MLKDVIAIDKIIGMPILSRQTGNNVGKVHDLYIDPQKGVLKGVTIEAPNGKLGGIDFHDVYSFGQDAVMIDNDQRIVALADGWVESHPHARKHLIGTNVISDGGKALGKVGNVYLRLVSPPVVIYEITGSVLDNWLGRNQFIYASDVSALAGNAERLIVPEEVVTNAASNLTELFSRPAAGMNQPPQHNRAVS